MKRTPFPISLTSSLRCGAAAVVATAALLISACGSSTVAPHRLASASAFTAVHSAQEVVQHFKAVTGDTLTVSRDPRSWDTLSMPSSDTQAYDRYGVFSIDVLHNSRELNVFTTSGGRSMVHDAQGVYWPLTADSSGYYNPVKVYGNVVLTWTTTKRVTDSQFRLLDAILSTLGQGVAAVDAKLPPSQLSCQTRGITPTGHAEGTCSDNGVSITTVNRNHVLHGPGYDVQVVKIKTGSVIDSASAYDDPLSAKGRFIAIGLHVSNTGNGPLDGLFEAELNIGGRYYSQDDEASFRLAPDTTFPLQPQESGHTVMVFDVPRQAAADALSQGELVFPGERDSTIKYSSKLDAIRLAQASAGDGEPAPAPAGETPAA